MRAHDHGGGDGLLQAHCGAVYSKDGEDDGAVLGGGDVSI